MWLLVMELVYFVHRIEDDQLSLVWIELNTVIDVYQDWCGPCAAMAGHLKEIKLQLGDDLLHCALVGEFSSD